MTVPSSPVTRPEVALAALCGVVGAVVSDPGQGVLWAIVGYFVGKSVRSTLRAFGRGTT